MAATYPWRMRLRVRHGYWPTSGASASVRHVYITSGAPKPGAPLVTIPPITLFLLVEAPDLVNPKYIDDVLN